jgi:protein-S-isoprenylcysteine O-methyltransferase Ste14
VNENIFRILAVVMFLTGAGISSYHRRRADRETGEKVSLHDEGLVITVALRVIGLTLWLSIIAWMVNPGWMSWSQVDQPVWARWLGVVLGAFALLLASRVFSSLGNNVSPTVATRSSAQLVKSGPYRWVRHPLYVMGLISYLGFSLLAENWFIAVLAVVVFVIIMVRTPKEEAKLVEKFGDEYRGYMQATGRYLPRLGAAGR